MNNEAAFSSRKKKRFPVGDATGTISITPDGHIQQGAGVVYMTQEVITDLSLGGTTETAVTGVSTTSIPCEACTEEGTILTGVSTTTDTFVTGVTLTPTTEEVVMPVVITDIYGNLVEVVRTEDDTDNMEAGGSQFSSLVENIAPIRREAVSDKSRVVDPNPPDTSFTFTMDTENAGSATKTFVLPLVSDGVIDIDVDWGDGSTNNITLYNQPEVTHIYSATGTYTVKLSGTIRGFTFNNTGDKLKILNISQWGDLNITQTMTFRGCTNLTSDATDAPNIGTDNLTQIFENCSALNGGTTGWDVSSVINMNSVFRSCTVFNQDLSSWDVSSVTNMYQMFQYANAFNNSSLNSWDVSNVTTMYYMFNCTAFQGAIGGWDTGEVTDMSNMFRSPSAFNQDISSWDTAKVTTIAYMFYWNTTFNQDIGGWDTGAMTTMTNALRYTTQFNQDISGWDISNVTSFGDLMEGDTLSTVNYDALLTGWNAQAVVSGLSFHAGSSIYTNCVGAAFTARENLISSDTWTITDGGGVPASCSSPFTFGIVATGSSFTLPLINDGVIDMDVDWGDGSDDTITTWNQAETTHAYAGSGTYTIEITGTIRGWRFWWGGSVAQMRDISNWGDFDFTTYGAFAGASSLTCSATDIPNISGSSLGYSFYSCSLFNGDVTGWDTAAITDMNGMFTICNAFTGVGIGGWDVSNCTGFNAMFVNAALFNQDISGWNTSSLQNIGQMFSGCTIFNQDLSGWDVSNVSNMGSVFQQCTAFNQDLSSWDTGNATSMNDMFYGCALFNADISGWDVSKNTNFQNTFNACTAFNQDLSSWNVGLCTRTIGMFQYATSFNADISGWNVSNVEYFGSMFRGANFNQDIGGWNTSSALNMFYMFRDNTAFDQDISSWDISGVTNFDSFMQGATLSTVNYDALLIGWEAQSVVSGITTNFGSSKYTGGGAAATARAALIAAPNSWTITDGGIA